MRPSQPPSLKPSTPAGSWMTPSSETFSLMTILPIAVLLPVGLAGYSVIALATGRPGVPTPSSHCPCKPTSMSLRGWPGARCVGVPTKTVLRLYSRRDDGAVHKLSFEGADEG